MHRYDIRVSELTSTYCGQDLAEKIAVAEEQERMTDALERIATALESLARHTGTE